MEKNWIASDRFIPRRFVRPVLRLTQRSAASGIVLVIAAVVAMLWANLPVFGDSYLDFWQNQHLEVSFGPVHFTEDFKHLVNDGLMTIFFFVVGLEIKRELVLGELRDRRKAALPVVAALGGMVLPALIYVAFNAGDAAALRGWGVPMATDIAFSLGVLALVGSRAPVGARLFLLAVAIADDIGAIVVIAIFYTEDLSFGYLWLGIAVLVLMAVGSKVNIRSHIFYAPMAVIAWFCFLESGVHGTIAGVILGFITPSRPLYDAQEFDRAARRIVDIFPADSARALTSKRRSSTRLGCFPTWQGSPSLPSPERSAICTTGAPSSSFRYSHWPTRVCLWPGWTWSTRLRRGSRSVSLSAWWSAR